MIVLVTGGRNYANRGRVYSVLSRLHAKYPITLLVQGGSYGADMLADHWAIANGVPRKTVHAEWDRYGPSAGPARNAAMYAQYRPDLVVAFPGGKGTRNMLDIAEADKCFVYEIEP